MLKLCTVALVILLIDVAISYAAVVKDQTCTRKDGSTYACSVKQAANHEHMLACSKEWSNAKTDPAVKSAGWPAYWHTCSQAQKALDNAKRD